MIFFFLVTTVHMFNWLKNLEFRPERWVLLFWSECDIILFLTRGERGLVDLRFFLTRGGGGVSQFRIFSWQAGEGGVWTHSFLADIICEQPLTMRRKNPEKLKLWQDTKSQIVTKLKPWIVIKLKNLNWDKTPNLKNMTK